jgi:hypothetical protein
MSQFEMLRITAEVAKLWSAPQGNAAGPLEGRDLSVWELYLFLAKYGRKIKYIFWYEFCLVEIFYVSLSTVLAPNYKQHILPPAKVSLFSLL